MGGPASLSWVTVAVLAVEPAIMKTRAVAIVLWRNNHREPPDLQDGDR
jgi:hypothetical protein